MKSLHLLKQKLAEYETALKEKELHILELSGRHKTLLIKMNGLKPPKAPCQDTLSDYFEGGISKNVPFSNSEYSSYSKEMQEYRSNFSAISGEMNAMSDDILSSRTIYDMLKGAVQAYQEAIDIVEKSSLE